MKILPLKRTLPQLMSANFWEFSLAEKFLSLFQPKRVFRKLLTTFLFHWLKYRCSCLSPGSWVKFHEYSMKILDGESLYGMLRNEYFNKIYFFECDKIDPYIIDGGSNLGLSIFYFKELYPHARIVGFEPDKEVFSVLEENIKRNSLGGVKIHNCGLGKKTGKFNFKANGTDGGRFFDSSTELVGALEMVQLSSFISEEIDFLKLNVEGEEFSVLFDLDRAKKLRFFRAMAIEYHGGPNFNQTLGEILEILKNNGFQYLINGFDIEITPFSTPPISWSNPQDWFLLIYAKRME